MKRIFGVGPRKAVGHVSWSEFERKLCRAIPVPCSLYCDSSEMDSGSKACTSKGGRTVEGDEPTGPPAVNIL